MFFLLCLFLFFNLTVRTETIEDLVTDIQNGTTKNVKKILQNQPGLLLQSFENDTPIHWAVSKNQLDILKHIVENVVDPYAYFQVTPLHPLKSKTPEGYNALHMAVNYGNATITNYLLPWIIIHKLLNDKTNDGQTALYVAVSVNNLGLTELLLRAGADPRKTDKKRVSPLKLAKNNNNDGIQQLISKYLPVHKEKEDLTLEERQEALKREALSPGLFRRELLDAVENNSLFNLKQAEKKYAEMYDLRYFLLSDFQVQNDMGEEVYVSILHYAIDGFAQNKVSIELIKYLIEKIKPHLGLRDIYGNAALHIAIENSNNEIVKLLLEAEADVNLQNKRGLTPLHRAAFVNNVEGAKLLIKKEAGIKQEAEIKKKVVINAKDNEGETPLHVAVRGGYESFANNLIEKKANLNAQNNRGMTPLYVAIEMGDARMIEFLLQKKTDLNILDVDGNTPIHHFVMKAQFKKNQTAEILRVLSGDENKNLEIKNERGETPLLYALKLKKLDFLNLIVDQVGKEHIWNQKDKQGNTIVHYLARLDLLQKDSPKIWQYITGLDGFDDHINDENEAGQTPIQVAVVNKNNIAIEGKLSADGEVEIKSLLSVDDIALDSIDKFGNSVFHYLPALSVPDVVMKKIFEHEQATEELLNKTNVEGETALHLAVSELNIGLTKALLEKNVERDIQTAKLRSTPLHYCIESLKKTDYSEHAKKIPTLLIEAGADTSIRDKFGKTALQMAPKQLANELETVTPKKAEAQQSQIASLETTLDILKKKVESLSAKLSEL